MSGRRRRPGLPGARALPIRVRLTLLFALSLVAGSVVLLGAVLLTVDSVAERQSLVLDPQYAPLVEADGRPGGRSMETAKREAVQAQDRFTRRLRTALVRPTATRGGLVVAGIGIVGLGLGRLWSGQATRPVRNVSAQARRIAGGGLHQRIETDGPQDEIRELAETFNDLVERLEVAVDSQWRFIANASHELRTPLAINRTLLEVAMGRKDAPEELLRLGENLLAVNSRNERLVLGLLTLARSEHRVIAPVPVRLEEVLTRVVELSAADAERAGVTVRVDAGPAVVDGDPALLERLMLNLLQNAVRYNVADGWVEASTGVEGDSAVLTVANSGPVVPAYQTAGLFDAFHRLEHRVGSSSGIGLGLSIVRSVARAHAGDARIGARPEGGLVITVELPRKADGQI